MKYMPKSWICAALCFFSTTTAQAGYFKDDFSWGANSDIWSARSGSNASPFGCGFTPGMATILKAVFTFLVSTMAARPGLITILLNTFPIKYKCL